MDVCGDGETVIGNICDGGNDGSHVDHDNGKSKSVVHEVMIQLF